MLLARLWHGELGALIVSTSSKDRKPIILAGHRDSHMQFMSKLNIGDKIELMMSDRVLKTFIISKTDITKKPELAGICTKYR